MKLTAEQINQVERLEEHLHSALASFLAHETLSSHVIEVVLSRWPARLLAPHLNKTSHSPKEFDRLVKMYANNHAQQLRYAYCQALLTSSP